MGSIILEGFEKLNKGHRIILMEIISFVLSKQYHLIIYTCDKKKTRRIYRFFKHCNTILNETHVTFKVSIKK
jgi:hypothetical protein